MSDATDDALYGAVKQRLLEAFDLPEAERDAWLAQLERTDAAVAQRVRRLLDAEREAGSFLDLPASGAMGPETIAPGERIGAFTVLREIGHGGMGTVLLGSRHEGGFTQQVAIKVIRGVTADPHAAERLREERRILATLNHPLIAHFVDGGTTSDGRPFLAMEHVEGVPITTFCEAAPLSQRDRVSLFMRVCQAVHFAHQRLVVHRDIKPSNILVTADGTPKLLDFGIAKLIDPLHATGTATVRVLTPFYASPEQAAGAAVTTSTDVYSLGVLLYELLTGTSPYRSVSADSAPLAVLDAIRTETPQPPSVAAGRANRVVDEDLDAIVLKTLRKEEADRYGSVEQLTQDLARYIEGEPVRAHDGSRGYRARKFVARHRGAVAATVVAVVSLTAATAVSTWQAQVARRERARADERFNDLRRLANAVVGPLYDQIALVPGSVEARRVLVKEAIAYLDGLQAQASDDVSLKNELATAYEKIGDVQGSPRGPNLGDLPGAQASYAKLLALRQSVRAARPDDPESAIGLAQAIRRLADVSLSQNKSEDALRQYREALQLLGSPAKDQRDWIVRSALHERVGAALTNLDGQGESARAEFAKAIEFIEPAVSKPDAAAATIISLIATRSRLGDQLTYEGRHAEALVQFEAAYALSQRVMRLGPNAPARRQIYRSAARVGQSLDEQDRLDEALKYKLEAVAVNAELVALDPKDSGARQDLAIDRAALAFLYVKRREFPQAIREIADSLAIWKASMAANPGRVDSYFIYGESLIVLGRAEMGRDRLAAAVDAFQEAVKVLSDPRIDARGGPDLHEANERLGDALAALAARTGSADAARRGRDAWVAARDGYKALAAAGTLPIPMKGKPSELDAKLAK